jgi:hypothetical protein
MMDPADRCAFELPPLQRSGLHRPSPTSPTPDPTRRNVILDMDPPPVHPSAAVEVVVRVATVAATATTDTMVEAMVSMTMMMVAMAMTTGYWSRDRKINQIIDHHHHREEQPRHLVIVITLFEWLQLICFEFSLTIVTLNSYKFLLVAMDNMLQFQCISHLVAIVPILWILKENVVATDVLLKSFQLHSVCISCACKWE